VYLILVHISNDGKIASSLAWIAGGKKKIAAMDRNMCHTTAYHPEFRRRLVVNALVGICTNQRKRG
jgi:hypothetical protein